MAPQVDFTTRVFLPLARRLLGLQVELEIVRRGFFPRGGGEIRVQIDPVEVPRGFELVDRGEVVSVQGIVFSYNIRNDTITDRMVQAASTVLRGCAELADIEVKIDRVHGDAVGPGVGILLWATTSTGCILSGGGLGEKGKPAEAVALLLPHLP